MTTDSRYYLMFRRGVNKLITAFSTTMNAMENNGDGLGHLSHLRKESRERDHWNIVFDEFYGKWTNAFDNTHAVSNSRHSAMRDPGLQCLSQIMNDLRNDIWTDKKMQTDLEPKVFESAFWKLVRQKMNYAPIMIACGVSRDRARRMTNFAAARRDILDNPLSSPTTEQEMLELIAKRIGKPWATVDKIGHELTIFLDAKYGSSGRILSLDEFDFLEPAQTHEQSIPELTDILENHCLPELRKHNSELFEVVDKWLKKLGNNVEIVEIDAPENQIIIQLLLECIERVSREKLK